MSLTPQLYPRRKLSQCPVYKRLDWSRTCVDGVGKSKLSSSTRKLTGLLSSWTHSVVATPPYLPDLLHEFRVKALLEMLYKRVTVEGRKHVY
jgi:hypothetical protein